VREIKGQEVKKRKKKPAEVKRKESLKERYINKPAEKKKEGEGTKQKE
jgi:hypothetical protein